MTKSLLSRAMLLAGLLVALVFGIVQAADTVTLNGYTIDFLGSTQSGSQSTWTYAVTVTGNPSAGLSHITFGLGTCANLVAPPEGSYTTPTTPAECSDGTYSCQSTTYNVVHGYDPTTGVTGIKFEDPADQLEDGVTVSHIFEITLNTTLEAVPEQDQPVAVKTGGSEHVGVVTGAACPSPTAVTLTGAQAEAGVTSSPLPLLLGILLLSAVSVITRRRARA